MVTNATRRKIQMEAEEEVAAIEDEFREEEEAHLSPEEKKARRATEARISEALEYTPIDNKYYPPVYTCKMEGSYWSCAVFNENDPMPFTMLRIMRAASKNPALKKMKGLIDFIIVVKRIRNRGIGVPRRNPMRKCRISALKKGRAMNSNKGIETPPNLFFFRRPIKKIGKRTVEKWLCSKPQVEKLFRDIKERAGWSVDK